jgi:hypothetical protein
MRVGDWAALHAVPPSPRGFRSAGTSPAKLSFGIRLARRGYQTRALESATYEEANSRQAHPSCAVADAMAARVGSQTGPCAGRRRGAAPGSPGGTAHRGSAAAEADGDDHPITFTWLNGLLEETDRGTGSSGAAA